MTKASAHFTWEELTHSDTALAHGIKNDPTPEHRENATKYLLPGMELLRHLLGGTPLTTNVAYRNPKVNKLVGGTPTSDHCQFYAWDGTRPGETPMTTGKRIAALMKSGQIKIDQMIVERAPGRVVHVSFNPRARGMMGYQPGGPGTPIDWGFFK